MVYLLQQWRKCSFKLVKMKMKTFRKSITFNQSLLDSLSLSLFRIQRKKTEYFEKQTSDVSEIIEVIDSQQSTAADDNPPPPTKDSKSNIIIQYFIYT